MRYIIIILGIFLLTLTSCEKLGIDDCFKGAGKTIIEPRDIPDFKYINLEDNVNLVITQNNRCSVKVETGENLLAKVITEVTDSTLFIRNQNTCNWSRDYSNDITVYISFKELTSINYRSSGNIVGTNTIVSDSLNISVWDGSGIIDLDIDTKKSVMNLNFKGSI